MTASRSPKQAFLETYDKEHQTTMKVLRAYPTDKLELRPHAMCKTARELAFVFAAERGLGTVAMHDGIAKGEFTGEMPKAPEKWDDLLAAVEKAHHDFGDLVRKTSDAELEQPVKFFSGPKQLGDWPRLHLLWHLLHDEIHHRGQFSIYLRMAGGKVPSIYGPTADEPWM
ncbi:MAG TPA: DinB family protein [Gaiellaceae bacterium]|nr:DinB family protein [Gaiellaceae bacterium]